METHYGRWTVIRIEILRKRSGKKERFAICQCACGSPERPLALYHLTGGKSKSCGCFRDAKITTHGMSKSSEYGIWKAMSARCEKPSDVGFKNYGARGIIVSPEFHDFACFYEHVGNRPSMAHSLNRIDNNRAYERGNLQWATHTQQMRNTRANHLIEYNGRSQSVVEWAEEIGLNIATFHQRLRLKWDIERILTTPPVPRKKPIVWRGPTP